MKDFFIRIQYFKEDTDIIQVMLQFCVGIREPVFPKLTQGNQMNFCISKPFWPTHTTNVSIEFSSD